jgi:hypothetical protein
LNVGGMRLQCAAILVLPLMRGFAAWATALVYPLLLAAVSDVAHPDWRASAAGVYQLWRDSGHIVERCTPGHWRTCLEYSGLSS